MDGAVACDTRRFYALDAGLGFATHDLQRRAHQRCVSMPSMSGWALRLALWEIVMMAGVAFLCPRCRAGLCDGCRFPVLLTCGFAACRAGLAASVPRNPVKWDSDRRAGFCPGSFRALTGGVFSRLPVRLYLVQKVRHRDWSHGRAEAMHYPHCGYSCAGQATYSRPYRSRQRATVPGRCLGRQLGLSMEAFAGRRGLLEGAGMACG